MRKKYLLRLAALCVLVFSWLLLEATKIIVEAEDYSEKLEASLRTQQCIDAIRQLKIEQGVPIDSASDINLTGVIGQEYSFITTTLGNLEAKRSSTNPNMAAVVVDMFHELSLQAGDKVAINCSGSFPALNIAVMCAVDVMELEPFWISSFGSSTHGANDPELTWLDMEHYLYEQGLIFHKSDLFSIGGMLDMGLEMPREVVEEIIRRIQGYGYELFYDEDLLHNVEQRFQIYRNTGEVRCFINIGGNDASFGDSSVMVHTDGGILTELSEKDRSTGLVQLFLKDGIPVIHLLNIKSLAVEYGLPIDPSPLPGVGNGEVYHVYYYNKWIAIVGVVMAAALLWFGREKKTRTDYKNI